MKLTLPSVGCVVRFASYSCFIDSLTRLWLHLQASNDQLMVYPAQVLTSRLQRQQLGLWLRASSLLFSTSNGIVHLRCTASLILTYEFDSLRTLSYSVSAAAAASSIVPSLTTSSKLHALLPDTHESSSSSSSIISYLHSDHHLSESSATITSASRALSEANQSSSSHHRINRPLARDDDIQGETQGPESVRSRGKRFSLPHHTRVSSSIHSSSSSPSLSNHHGQQIHHSSSTSTARRNNRTKQHHQHHQLQQQGKQLHERHLTARSSQLRSAHHEINGNPSAPGNLHRLSSSSSDYNSLPSDRDSGLFFMNSGNHTHKRQCNLAPPPPCLTREHSSRSGNFFFFSFFISKSYPHSDHAATERNH